MNPNTTCNASSTAMSAAPISSACAPALRQRTKVATTGMIHTHRAMTVVICIASYCGMFGNCERKPAWFRTARGCSTFCDMAGSMAALYAATGIIAHHDGVKHAPQSNINSMAMVHADERAYSPTAAQHMASNAPHTSSADTSPTIYRFAISPNVRNMA